MHARKSFRVPVEALINTKEQNPIYDQWCLGSHVHLFIIRDTRVTLLVRDNRTIQLALLARWYTSPR